MNDEWIHFLRAHFFMPQEKLREALKPLAVDFESSQASRESNLLGRVLDVI